jgi:hypothetical protein
VTSRDQVIAVWERKGPEGGEGPIKAATNKDGMHFSKPRRISKRNERITDCSSPSLTVSPTGTVLAEWECLTKTPENTIDEFSRYEP